MKKSIFRNDKVALLNSPAKPVFSANAETPFSSITSAAVIHIIIFFIIFIF